MTTARNLVAMPTPREDAAVKLAMRDLVKTRMSSAGRTVTVVDHVSFEVAAGEFVRSADPEVGASSPARMFMIVVLPQPLGPRRHTNSPTPTSNDT